MQVNSGNMDYNYLMKHQKNITENLAKKNKEVIIYDFKIISFKLGDEYYGIDILYVKEILKDSKFTKVPNTLEFVEGVYNLRGEIIPVIDLATMFHIKSGKANELKSIIVIKVENLLIGVIVDEIYRVIPLRKADIQPPSPLLGRINEKFITGVATVEGRLNVIFDTDAIFSEKEISKKEVLQQETSDLSEDFFVYFCNQIEQLTGCFIHDVNRTFFRTLYTDYIKENNITEMPTLKKEESESIIKKFYSKHSSEFWKEPYINYFKDSAIGELTKFCSDEVRVFNAGCGNGFETFSILLLLHNYFPDAYIDINAADNNLTAISNATRFEVSKNQIPSWIAVDDSFIKTKDGNYKITKELVDKVYFEFHDIKNIAGKKQEFDLVVARDVSLNLSDENYKKFINSICEKLSSGGVIVIGDNEDLAKHPALERILNKNISCYVKK